MFTEVSVEYTVFIFRVDIMFPYVSPLGTPVIVGPILADPDDRLMWRSWKNENWHGKPKYSEKTWPSNTVSTTNPT
jgi:hypothetical protein